MPNGWIDPSNYGPHSRQWLGHSFRYHLARGYLSAGDHVLDAACGCGYGMKVMASAAYTVWGVDIDREAIKTAQENYLVKNGMYSCLDLDAASTLPTVDVAVSFETVEHLENPAHFADLLKAAARRLIIFSAPIIPTVGRNPHHKRDFTEQTLLALFLDSDWALWEKVRQGPYLIAVVYRKEAHGKTF